MRRLAIAGAIYVACVWFTASAIAQSRFIVGLGQVSATDQEAQECYFNIGFAYVVLKPDGDPCKWMRMQVGKGGTLFFVPDE